MSRLLLLAIAIPTLLFLVSCGKTEYVVQTKEVPGPTTTVEVPVAQDFEGVFYLPHNGYIELIQAEDGDVYFDTSYQSIVSKNKGPGAGQNSFANHPSIGGKYEVNNGVIFFGRDVDYKSSNQYDLEADSDGANITGKHYTTFKVEKVDDDIKLTITIYSGTKNDNLNWILTKRVLRSH